MYTLCVDTEGSHDDNDYIQVCVCVNSLPVCVLVDEVFSDLSLEPLGAASLAQVHRATLRSDQSQVAIKVQHPYVRNNGHTDIDTIDVRTLILVSLSAAASVLSLH